MRVIAAAVVAVTLEALLTAAGPPQAKPKPRVKVAVPLIAEPVVADQLRERRVGVGEPFFIQRLSAVKSVTLQADVRVPSLLGDIGFVKGARLLLAAEQGGDADLYCGAFRGKVLMGNRNQQRQWICFEDVDGDSLFDVAYAAPDNAGAFLPSFEEVRSPKAVKAPFVQDPEGDRYAFEVGFVYETTGVRSGLGNVVEKVRGAGDAEWSDPLIGIQSRTGYSTWISGMDFPEDVTLDRARFTVVGGDKSGLTVQPVEAATGAFGYTVRRCKGFGLKY